LVCQWKPDTCNCIILYDNKTFEIVDQYKNKKTIPCKIHEELKGQDLLNFVIPENQTSNQFYQDWTEKEISENMDIIKEYKKVFIEVPDLIPIKNLSFVESKKQLRG
jgi:hypothetical protein